MRLARIWAALLRSASLQTLHRFSNDFTNSKMHSLLTCCLILDHIHLNVCRHGDKWDESPVFSDAEYEAVTKRLRQTDPALTNQLFLSTEDPVTIQYYSNTTNSSAAASWRTSYTELENDSYDGVDYGLSAEVIKCLLNLDLAMQCDGYVASVYSNWAR